MVVTYATELRSSQFCLLDADAPLSKVAGAFTDPTRKAVVVTDDSGYVGVVTRRQLLASHRHPDAKVRTCSWPAPTVDDETDLREAARLMVGSRSTVLCIVTEGEVDGVVTAPDLFRAVGDRFGALVVADVASVDPVTVRNHSTLGTVLNRFREHGISHLPIVDDDGVLAGVLSVHDVTQFVTRDVDRSQGGSTALAAGGRSHGGFGAREGELERLLDLPVRDLTTDVVVTAAADERLDSVVEQMLDADVSSVVVVDDGRPTGIVTQVDLLDALTWTDEGRRGVQVYGVNLLDDITYDEVADLVESLVRKAGDTSLLDAKIHLHEHDEKMRGTPLLYVRVRLTTDAGLFIGTGEGYGARHALRAAKSVLERRLREAKTYRRTKKHPDDETRRRLRGW